MRVRPLRAALIIGLQSADNGRVLLSIVVIVVGACALLLGSEWVDRVNPRSRLPWVGSPPNRPGGVLGLNILGVLFMIYGVSLVGHHFSIWIGAAVLVGVGLVAVIPTQIRHNRRVARMLSTEYERPHHQ